MIIIFGDFYQFSAEKNRRFLSKNQCYDNFFAKISSSLSKKMPNFFRHFFRRNYFTNRNIGPRRVFHRDVSVLGQGCAAAGIRSVVADSHLPVVAGRRHQVGSASFPRHVTRRLFHRPIFFLVDQEIFIYRSKISFDRPKYRFFIDQKNRFLSTKKIVFDFRRIAHRLFCRQKSFLPHYSVDYLTKSCYDISHRFF
jgi:hypothetical protein